MADRRPREAWQNTGTSWKPELAYGGVGGGLSIVVCAAAGWPESAAVTAAIPLVSAVGAAILVPLSQFLWRLLWQPWDDMKAKVVDLGGDGASMDIGERLVVVLRDYRRQGLELEAIRHAGAKTYNTSELDELEDWTHSVVTCLAEYGTKEQCERFIKADEACSNGYASHREWANARLAALEQIIEELDPESSSAALSTSI